MHLKMQHITLPVNGNRTYHVVEADAPALKDDLTRECTQRCKVKLKQNIMTKTAANTGNNRVQAVEIEI